MTRRKKSDTPTLDRLAELDQAMAVARERKRDLEAQHRHATEQAERIQAARVDAFAADDEPEAERLQAQHREARAQAEELGLRIEGANQRIHREQVERATFVASNGQALIRERMPRAQAAVDRIHEGLRILEQGRQAWHAEEQWHTALQREIPGGNPRSIPQINAIDDAARRLHDAMPELAPPVPQDATPVGLTIDQPPADMPELAPGETSTAWIGPA